MIGGHCDCLGGMDAPLAATLSSYLVMDARGLLIVRGSLSNVNAMIRLSVATLLHEGGKAQRCGAAAVLTH